MVPFYPKSNAVALLEKVQYHSMDNESPHEHLEELKNKCQFMKVSGVTEEAIYLTMFPHTLQEGLASKLPSGQIQLLGKTSRRILNFLLSDFKATGNQK